MVFSRGGRQFLGLLSLTLSLAVVSCSSGGSGGGGGSTPPPPPSPTPSGGWALTGSLNSARDSHTATVLTLGPNTGKVLVTGGASASGTTPIIFASTELYDPVAGNWVFATPMTVQRRNHTATLLPDGKVLVTGGFTSNIIATSTVEIYDPATGAWAPEAPMGTPRAVQTATLLPNGTVLVAGGTPIFNGPSLQTAEVYNPSTHTWTPTGPMVLTRQAHVAILLQTGKVLVTGTTGFGQVQAELFDPSTNTWSATGNLVAPTTFSGAALLPNGKVLVAGGVQGGVPLPTAILYDPIAATWTSTASMSSPRGGPAVVLLPTGTALIAGGLTTANTVTALAEAYVPSSGTWTASGSIGAGRSAHTTTLLPTGQVLVAGGVGSDTSRLASAVLFTPTLPGTAGTWTATGSMNIPRLAHTATQLTLGPNAGKILAAAGETASFTATESAELYDPAGSTWTTTGAMTVARQAHTASILVSGTHAGKILVAGGLVSTVVSSNALNSAELYDPLTGTWASTGLMNNPRGAHAAVLLTSGPNAGKILVAGGLSIPVIGGLLPTNTAELFDPVSGTWSSTGSMSAFRSSFTLTMLPTGKVLAAGGPTLIDEIYDPATGTWTVTGSLSTRRIAHSATLLAFGATGGRVLVAGGQDNNLGLPLSSSELYDPILGTWTNTGNLQQGRFAFTATRLPNGQVLAAGGDLSTTTNTATAEVFNSRTGTWSPTNLMINGRGQHTAVLLPQGQVLVSGGDVAGAPSVLSELYSSSIP